MRRLQLGLTFLRIGAVAFGGLGATLALIERELVQRRPKSVLGTPVTIAVAGCALLLVAVLKIGALWTVIAAGVFGMMALRGQDR